MELRDFFGCSDHKETISIFKGDSAIGARKVCSRTFVVEVCLKRGLERPALSNMDNQALQLFQAFRTKGNEGGFKGCNRSIVSRNVFEKEGLERLALLDMDMDASGLFG